MIWLVLYGKILGRKIKMVIKMDLLSLPLDVQKEVVKQLPLPDLLHLCQTSKRFAALCNDEGVWKLIAQKHYPGTYPELVKHKVKHWKDIVIQLYKRDQQFERFMKELSAITGKLSRQQKVDFTESYTPENKIKPESVPNIFAIGRKYTNVGTISNFDMRTVGTTRTVYITFNRNPVVITK
jgi:hypothetical protein